MAAFHVFVEGATDGSPAGLARLAEAIGKHYGLPAADLHGRLATGRFRVKGNTDRATAEQYVRDLERLGARCVIEAVDERSESLGRGSPAGFAGRAGGEAPRGIDATATAPPSTPRASTPPPAGGFQSGLSAAFAADQPAADLGALGRGDVAFSLSSVDGAEGGEETGAPSFEPPSGGFAASIGPAPEKQQRVAPAAKPIRPKDEPLDMFLPPDAQGEEMRVDLADDDRAVAHKRASAPLPAETAPEPPPRAAQPARKSQPSLQPQNVPAASIATRASKLGPLGDDRVRFAAGVLLALALGFAPAHWIAGMREESAYKVIDNKVIAMQQQADTADTYARLDKMRADQLGRKESEQRNAAIIGFAVWALVAGALAFVWFKKIPWERLEG